MEEIKKGIRLLGVDFGLKRIGVSVCDSEWILASPLPVIYTKSMRSSIDAVAVTAKNQSVGGIVVGLPLNLDGSESVQSGRVRAFSKNLERVTGIKTVLFDERLTTVEANELLLQAGVTKSADRAKLIDSMSAKVILQSYIDNNKNSEKNHG
ncbi:MAG: Holliday junction resolvase RuvX [Clostridiales bacterium]|nr:Holliday junction resolvase RuvX [Clostridiales bacterium]